MYQNPHPSASPKKPILNSVKNFEIFTGKHLCSSLFLRKLQAYRLTTCFKKTPTQALSCEYCKSFE